MAVQPWVLVVVVILATWTGHLLSLSVEDVSICTAFGTCLPSFTIPLLSILSATSLTVYLTSFTSAQSPLRAPSLLLLIPLYALFQATLAPCFQDHKLLLSLLSIGIHLQLLQTVDDLVISGVSYNECMRFREAAERGSIFLKDKLADESLMLGEEENGTRKRIHWGIAQLFNFVGALTPWAIPGVPTSLASPELGSTRISRAAFLRRHCARLLMAYLVIDLVDHLPPIPDARLISIESQGLAQIFDLDCITFRAPFIVIFVASTFATLNMIYSCFVLLAVGLVGVPMEMYPPLWGSLSDAYTVRRVWGKFWHQQLRRSIVSTMHFLTHSLLRLPPRSFPSRYLNLLGCFAISVFWHFQFDLRMGIPRHESGAAKFFLGNGIFVGFEVLLGTLLRRWSSFGERNNRSRQTMLAKASEKEKEQGAGRKMHGEKEIEVSLEAKHETDHVRRWVKTLGFIYTALWLLYSVPIWAYPHIRCEGEQGKRLPWSVVDWLGGKAIGAEL